LRNNEAIILVVGLSNLLHLRDKAKSKKLLIFS